MYDNLDARAFKVVENCLKMPTEERTAYFNHHRGEEPQVYKRAWELLNACGEMSSFMDTPLSTDDEERLPKRIGHYQIMSLLGEGGMGRVYLAKQQEPVERLVALKTLKVAWPSREQMARFKMEYRVLAGLPHPNLACFFEADTWEDMPYFTMEYLKGQPINSYCSTHQLTLTQRLGLFLQACKGINYAHRHGILHRDLKPSNIIVCQEEAEPVTKIIDFGIARNIQRNKHDDEIRTQGFLGSPAYMSPERLEGENGDIRTDVYGLGAVLYEMIAGQPFYDESKVAELSFNQKIRHFLEVRTLPPSRRLISGIPQREVRGDLDRIALKALEANPEERYSSVDRLIEDLTCFLDCRPIRIEAPGILYRANKFVRRNHPNLITLIAILLTTSMVGYSTWQYRTLQVQQTGTEVHEFAGKSQALESILLHLFKLPNPYRENKKKLDTVTFLNEAASETRKLMSDYPETALKLSKTLAKTQASLGNNMGARTQLKDALYLAEIFGDHEMVLELSINEAYYLLREGRLGASEKAFRQILVKLEDNLLAMGAQRGLGHVLVAQSRHKEGESLLRELLKKMIATHGKKHRETLRTMRVLGCVLQGLSRQDEALVFLEETVIGMETLLGANHAEYLLSLRILARARMEQGQYKEANEMLTLVADKLERSLGDSHPVTLKSKSERGYNLSLLGELELAKTLLHNTYQLQCKQLSKNHLDTQQTGNSLAIVLGSLGCNEEMASLLEELLKARQLVLAPDHNETLLMKNNLADTYIRLDRFVEAEQLLWEIYSLLRNKNGDKDRTTLVSRCTLAEALMAQHKYEEATHHLEEMMAMAELAYPPNHPHTAIFSGLWGRALKHSNRPGNSRAVEHLLRLGISHSPKLYRDLFMEDLLDLLPAEQLLCFQSLAF